MLLQKLETPITQVNYSPHPLKPSRSPVSNEEREMAQRGVNLYYAQGECLVFLATIQNMLHKHSLEHHLTRMRPC